MQTVLYRPARDWRSRSVFGALRLRPPIAQHTPAEGTLLRTCANDKRTVVEIGVAEGGSAWEARRSIAPDGTLYLIDPYHLGNAGPLTPSRLIARRLVGSVHRGEVVWIQDFSHNVVSGWSRAIDFLFIDGDHSLEGVRRDWDQWTPHVAPDGLVALHDASLDADWTHPEDGPVMFWKELQRDPEWEFVDSADSLVVLRRAA